MVNRVAPFDWQFTNERCGEIATNWQGLVSKNPTLFDGRVMMGHQFRFEKSEGGSFISAHFETSFSAFCAWRDFGFPESGVRDVFSMYALRSADGAFLLGEMAAHTANAGKVYFPTGIPDPDDVEDGRVDFAASAARELLEETGLDMGNATVDPVWSIVSCGPHIACMRPATLDASADEISARVADFLAIEQGPELVRMRAIRTMSDVGAINAPDFIRFYLASEIEGYRQ